MSARPAPGSRRRGVALILVLWLVVILGAIGATVVGAARTSSVLATNVRAGVVSRYAAESGIEATVSAIERELAARPDSMARAAFLNALEDVARDSIVLGEGRAAVAISDPTARLDVNAAPATGLAALLAQFTDVGRASETARAVRAWIERSPDAADRGGLAPGGASPFVTPVRSLEELRSIPGVDVPALERAAPYLTVDGDGTVNVRSASDTVLASATGEQRGEPSRLVLIARGWQRGHPLTHEIQAIYAVSGSSLVLVHWRERDL